MKYNSRKSFYIRAHLKRISEDAYVYDEGFKEGFEEGLERGRAEAEKIANAKKMIEDNLPIKMIKRYTGLSEEKIKQLP